MLKIVVILHLFTDTLQQTNLENLIYQSNINDVPPNNIIQDQTHQIFTTLNNYEQSRRNFRTKPCLKYRLKNKSPEISNDAVVLGYYTPLNKPFNLKTTNDKNVNINENSMKKLNANVVIPQEENPKNALYRIDDESSEIQDKILENNNRRMSDKEHEDTKKYINNYKIDFLYSDKTHINKSSLVPDLGMSLDAETTTNHYNVRCKEIIKLIEKFRLNKKNDTVFEEAYSPLRRTMLDNADEWSISNIQQQSNNSTTDMNKSMIRKKNCDDNNSLPNYDNANDKNDNTNMVQYNNNDEKVNEFIDENNKVLMAYRDDEKIPLGYRKLNPDEIEKQLLRPIKSDHVLDISQLDIIATNGSRVCYSCSTNSDTSCWNPDKTTTIKYCPKGYEACVTKTFNSRGTEFLIRDCANSCYDVDLPILKPKHKYCSICHYDLCNGAKSINNSNVLFFVFLIAFTKYTFQ